MTNPEIKGIDLIKSVRIFYGTEWTGFPTEAVQYLLRSNKIKNEGEPVLLVNDPNTLRERDKWMDMVIVYPTEKGTAEFKRIRKNSEQGLNEYHQYLTILASYATFHNIEVDGVIFANPNMDVIDGLLGVSPDLEAKLEYADII